jgi:hypothetical protein
MSLNFESTNFSAAQRTEIIIGLVPRIDFETLNSETRCYKRLSAHLMKLIEPVFNKEAELAIFFAIEREFQYAQNLLRK